MAGIMEEREKEKNEQQKKNEAEKKEAKMKKALLKYNKEENKEAQGDNADDPDSGFTFIEETGSKMAKKQSK
jgi:hypothetical protein